jgi:hypothetical protein
VGRAVVLIEGLFALGCPVVCYWGFFLCRWWSGNGETFSSRIGRVGSLVSFCILVAMAKEFWPQGLRALRAALQKDTLAK